MSSRRPKNEPGLQKELAETKRENHKLKRQLAKLQKRLVKVLESGPLEGYREDEDIPSLDVSGVQCPNCQAQVSEVKIWSKTLKVCKACKWRSVI